MKLQLSLFAILISSSVIHTKEDSLFKRFGCFAKERAQQVESNSLKKLDENTHTFWSLEVKCQEKEGLEKQKCLKRLCEEIKASLKSDTKALTTLSIASGATIVAAAILEQAHCDKVAKATGIAGDGILVTPGLLTIADLVGKLWLLAKINRSLNH